MQILWLTAFLSPGHPANDAMPDSDELTAKSLPSLGAYPIVRFPIMQSVALDLPDYCPAL